MGLLKDRSHTNLFNNRTELSVLEIRRDFEESLPIDGSSVDLPIRRTIQRLLLTGIKEHMRQYTNKNK